MQGTDFLHSNPNSPEGTPIGLSTESVVPIFPTSKLVYHHAIIKEFSVVIVKDLREFRGAKVSEISKKNLRRDDKTNGYMSPVTTRRVKDFLSVWLKSLDQNEVTPTFVTLTLPARQAHSDPHIKREALEPFIDALKKTHGVNQYFWRAEPQKNGNVHFHVLIDAVIKWQVIRRLWNNRMEELGYIEEYRQSQKEKYKNGFKLDKERLKQKNIIRRYQQYSNTQQKRKKPVIEFKAWERERQYKAYQEGVKCNWSNPNTTDIHAIRKAKSITAYVCKYVTKSGKGDSEENPDRKIKGRIWGASKGIKDLKPFQDLLAVENSENPEVSEYLGKFREKVEKDRIREDEFFTVLSHQKPQSEFLKQFSPSLFSKYTQYHNHIFTQLYHPPPEAPPEEDIEHLTYAPYSEIIEEARKQKSEYWEQLKINYPEIWARKYEMGST